MNRLTSSFIALVASAAAMFGQGYDHSLSLDAAPGWTLPTSPYFRGDNPAGHRFEAMLQGSLRWQAAFAEGSRAAALWPGLYMGAGIKAVTFMKPSLIGSPAGIYVFQGAELARFSPRLSLGYEWQFGATAPWQVMSRSHPRQMVNGSPVCAMLGASLLLRYKLDDDWSLIGGLDLAHYSNGNTRWPNAGTNTAALRIGVTKRLGSSAHMPDPCDTSVVSGLTARERWSLDLTAYGAWRKKCYHDSDKQPYPYPGRFGVAGLDIAPMYQLSRRFRVGPSLDLVYDESAVPKSHIIGDANSGTQPWFIRPPMVKQSAIGLAVSAEYQMPVFALNMSLGYNVLAGCHELRYFYQTLTLRTYITGRMWLNVGYSLRSFAHPRHLMLGIGLRLGGQPAPLPLCRL